MSLFNFIKSNVSILDVIADYVQLKSAGGYWKGPCPFHSETDASFTVSPDKGIFYCFGCHTSGDVVGFIAKKENLNQLEAAKHIIEQYKLQVPDDLKQGAFKNIKAHEEKDAYYKLCKEVADWANQQLLQNEEAQKYLVSRDITYEQIKLFNIGYFVGGINQMNAFTKKMITQGVLLKDLLEYGIVLEGRSYLYSPFEERIIFPIRDIMGRYIGFGGRVFRPGDERAKYYNSRESEGFAKGKTLFGLDLAKKSMLEQSSAFLVEGYLDCIAMVKNNYPNTIATLGTACTLDHLKTVARYINTLFILYDGDQAGQKAILRLTELCWEVNLELKVIKLPPGEDPASFMYKKNDLKPYIENAADIFTFFITATGGSFATKTLSEKLALGDKIITLIAKVTDGFKQDILLQQAASVMQIPFQTVKTALEKHEHKQFKAQNRHDYKNKNDYNHDQDDQSNHEELLPGSEVLPEFKDVQAEEISQLEEQIFSAIINSLGTLTVLEVESELLPHFSRNIQQLLQKLHNFVTTKPTLNDTFNSYLASLDEQERAWVIRVSIKYQTNASKELFEQLIFCFCKYHWKQIVKTVNTEMQKAKQENDIQKLNELFVRFSKLKQGILSRGLI